MVDTISLRGVKAYGYHGVLDFEKEQGQDFIVDIDLDVDLSSAAAADDLSHTVNYAEVAAVAVQVIEGPSFDLIEAVAGKIGDQVLAAQPLVQSIAVTVHKPQAPVGVPFTDVAVTLTRRRDVPVVIALGANLEDPRKAVVRAVQHLRRIPGVWGVRASGLFSTDPVGGPEQPDYVNAVATAHTSLTAANLLARLHAIEAEFGRTREVRWGARTLDLDLIQHGDPLTGNDLVSDDPSLTLPHPRAHERGFVLIPWLDVDPAAALRVGEAVVPVAELAEQADADGVRALPKPELR